MAEQVTNEFGIVFVDAEDVPDAARKSNRNDELWIAAAAILKSYPGQFAQVKVFESPTGAQQKASAINGDKTKAFPSAEWEARYSIDTEAANSTLFLAYREQA
jgi:hypothetical protein